MMNVTTTTRTLTDILIAGFKTEFEKEVENHLVPLIEKYNEEIKLASERFNRKVDSIISLARDKAKAEAAKASIDLLQEANFDLFDLRFGFNKQH